MAFALRKGANAFSRGGVWLTVFHLPLGAD